MAGGGSGKKNKIYPHTWRSGPDPLKHKQYLIWLQQKNQAQYRREGWTIAFEAWLDLWQGLWDQRGRTPQSLCMTRKDTDLTWELDNVEIITRAEHFRRIRERKQNETI